MRSETLKISEGASERFVAGLGHEAFEPIAPVVHTAPS